MLESIPKSEAFGPQTQVLCYEDWPNVYDEELIEVEFRLIYQGKLPAASQTNTRVSDKHRIRKALHPQLRELWKTHPRLSFYLNAPTYARVNQTTGETEYGPKRIEPMADNYARCGYRFVPLIGNQRFGMLACDLDILFLRRGHPGLITSGGDIDNRIKVLFDALRIPTGCQELGGESPGPDEDPFFCLLEDDSLITQIKITTDQLLYPPRDSEHERDVHLIMNVRVLGQFPHMM